VAARLIMEIIQAEIIGLGVHFRALHLCPYYRNRFGFQRGRCPVAGVASDRLASLPVHPGLSDRYVEGTVTPLAKVLAAVCNPSFRIDDDAKAAAAY
jgi:dTDP-4-amino-4,6-dideoxygalactose transaminase